jgi:hypothetical protein
MWYGPSSGATLSATAEREPDRKAVAVSALRLAGIKSDGSQTETTSQNKDSHMPRVVPSQIVALIDENFPTAREGKAFEIYPGNAPEVGAIVRLVGEIPDELLVLSGIDYNRLLLGLDCLSEAVERWRSRGGSEPARAARGMNAIVLVREAMVKCPDQSPSPTTTELTFVTDPALRDSIRLDISTATSSFHNGEWKGATVLAGAAAEALLLDAIQGTNQQSLMGLPDKPGGSPERWSFNELIDVAERLKLIKKTTADQARLGKDFRNLIHPGRAQRTGAACNRPTALTALAAVEHVANDLSSGADPR